MSLSVTVDHEAGLVRFTVVGALVDEEVLAVLAEGERDARPGYDVLSDQRGVTPPITPAQMDQVVAFLARPGSAFRGSRCAVVVGNTASFGMMRAMAAHLEPLGIRVRVFEDLNEAEAWLGKRP